MIVSFLDCLWFKDKVIKISSLSNDRTLRNLIRTGLKNQIYLLIIDILFIYKFPIF